MRRAAVLVVVLAAGLLVGGRPAAAKVIVDPSLQAEYARCGALIRATGQGGVLDALERSGKDFKIVPGPNSSQPADVIAAIAGFSTGGTLYWNPKDTGPLQAGVSAEGCASLLHEAQHLKDYNDGTDDKSECFYSKDGKQYGTGLPVAEVKATRTENKFRPADKQRTEYLGRPLPPNGAPCEKKKDPPPRRPNSGCSVGVIGANCGNSTGDPHLRTFDGLSYDFMAVGEFVLAQSTVGGLRIHVRQAALPGLRTFSVNSAVAADVAGDRVGFYQAEGRVRLRVNGSDTPLTAELALPKGGVIVDLGGLFEVRWPDGSVLEVRPIGTWGLGLSVGPAAAHRGKVSGLLGDFDGRVAEDLKLRSGGSIAASFETLYPGYADSWRLPQAESLFDYEPGNSTETFTDRSMPDRQPSIVDLPQRATAEVICRRAGVTDPTVLAGCVLDVALTGQSAFATEAAAAQRAVSGAGDVTVDGTATVTIDGKAGQRLYVDVPASTQPDGCDALRLHGPDRRLLAIGCVIKGRGSIDATVLPADGRYSISAAGGRNTVRTSLTVDRSGPITPDGPAVVATVPGPGGLSRLEFTATAGQKIFVDATSLALPDQCGVLHLRGPDGLLAAGCLIRGRGLIDGTVLTKPGRYAIEVDPADAAVGSVQLRLINATDRDGTATVDGPAVTATVDRPGASFRLTFSGTAGQRIAVTVDSTTLPDQCGLLELRDPAGTRLANGCVLGAGESIGSTRLPASGRYTLTVDPAGRDVGRIVLRIKAG